MAYQVQGDLALMGKAIVWSCVLGLVLWAFPARADIIPISEADCTTMKAHAVIGEGAPVGCPRLRVVTFSHWGFDGAVHGDGRLVVLDAVAPSVERIVRTLYEMKFPLQQAVPIEALGGDDEKSMAANNSSAFNMRRVAQSERLSLHAYGTAIDVNPLQNPYLTFRDALVTVSPPQGAAYLNRQAFRPGKPMRQGLAEEIVDVFAANGFFVWGGDWDAPIDYQHFDIGRALAERLTMLPPEQARTVFEGVVAVYRQCTAEHANELPVLRRQICVIRASH